MYDTGGNSNKLTILGVSEQRFTDYVYRNYSMIRAVVSVFADDTDTQPVAVFEAYSSWKTERNCNIWRADIFYEQK